MHSNICTEGGVCGEGEGIHFVLAFLFSGLVFVFLLGFFFLRVCVRFLGFLLLLFFIWP